MEMDPAAISAMLSSLKTVADVFKDWRQGGDKVTVTMDQVSDLTSAVLDAQDHALAARQHQYELMQRNDALETELQALKDWSAERANYELVSVSSYGAYVYAPKSGAALPGANHWLCQPCVENAKKGMMQFAGHLLDRNSGGNMAVWKCSVCQGEIRVKPNAKPGAAH